MYKQYDAAHNRALSVEEFIAINNIKLSAKPLVAELTIKISPLREELENVHKQRTENTSVVTAIKYSDKKTLADLLSSFNQLFFNYYMKIDQPEKVKAFTHSASHYLHGTDGILFNEANQRITDCENLGENLIDVGITAENLTDLKNETEIYRMIINKPLEIKKKNKTLKKKEDLIIKDINNIINLRLNKVMSSTFEKSDPELFAAYQLAARKENPGTRKLAIKGMIQNKETGEALKGVHIIIPALKIDHECRGKKGGYQIKNIETGIFPMRVEAKNFKAQEVTLVHNEGQTVEMNFLMEPELN
ncbi:hypothetical protein DWB61_05960 [Ancylomarina euxinus]|uniref:Carboxypeptidase regulatory-like domain-containing protein n=1 Tax=Ancylomarina euxinus TaxID=2283627 RepID=A0A425Y3X7_9BACT|nr:hypothetical protein [Ancylomarina euxinus]MCZ4694583.1 hypothetical protein [Ancylomarina euxinus]MUP14126.1 hypothetical protein [Ancylomarina euxinus]RRG22980.1 hypothetical protein DWB61_05960 [Ancylomarina euxinus]